MSLVSLILPKKNENNSTWGSSKVDFFVHFLGELKIPKRHFKINWPLERPGFRKETKMMLMTTGLIYKWLWLRSAGVDLPHICFNEQSVNVNCIKEEVWLQWHLLELFLRVGSTYILWYLYFSAEPVSAKARAKRRKV